MHQPTIDKPDLPEDFDPARAAFEYLRAHNAAQWSLVFVILFAFIALVTSYPSREARDAEDEFPFDDEPLDDDDRAAIADARAGTSYVSLDEYFERRNRAS